VSHPDVTVPAPAERGAPEPGRPRLRALIGGAERHGRLTVSDSVLRRAPYSPDRRLRVVVVAQEEILHWGFRVLLTEQPWIERCLAASTTEHAQELVRRYDIDVAVVGPMPGDELGLALSRRIQQEAPRVRVLLMSPDDGVSPRMAQAAGASGVIVRTWPAADLVTAVGMAGMGLTLFDHVDAPPSELSHRERDIIRLIAAGATNREIADRLYLSPNTIKQHASALYRKLEARNRAEAVRCAQQLGLIA